MVQVISGHWAVSCTSSWPVSLHSMVVAPTWPFSTSKLARLKCRLFFHLKRKTCWRDYSWRSLRHALVHRVILRRSEVKLSFRSIDRDDNKWSEIRCRTIWHGWKECLHSWLLEKRLKKRIKRFMSKSRIGGQHLSVDDLRAFSHRCFLSCHIVKK